MNPTPFSKLLIANRGEIAVRILRSAKAAGLSTVAVYSDADAGAPHVALADEAFNIGGAAPAESYLRIDRIIEAARVCGADAIHPGYGFLAENEKLPAACADAGLVFVGPSAASIRAMGDKAAAKALMIAAGVPCVPGYHGVEQDAEALQRHADLIGYPLMIKAAAGGGGRGMRLVESRADFAAALTSAKSETRSAFGDETILLERAIVDARHIEIQILADRYGHAIHLGERDCSVQRRHQKIIEETPSPAVSPELRAKMGETAVRAAQAINYEGAGTLEFLLDRSGAFYFMEMNTRLQVEHPVTEMVSGLDLVALQLEIAAGEPLKIQQRDVKLSGHSIEVRLCAEDPQDGFKPQSGTLSLWLAPSDLRVEHALRSGLTIPPFYDSMIAKLIAHASDREAARRKLIRGLRETIAFGVRTNQDFLIDCLEHPVFAAGGATTAFINSQNASLFPDRGDEEKSAAMIAAAMRYASADLALPHGFPIPVRWSRGENIFALRVIAGARGRCRVECEGESRELQLLGSSGDVVEWRVDGRRRKATFALVGAQIWTRLDDRVWDFLDVSFEPTTRSTAGGDGNVRAAMNGRVAAVEVAVGDKVLKGQKVLTLEAMKMEHVHLAALDGTIEAVNVSVGDQVEARRVLVKVKAE